MIDKKEFREQLDRIEDAFFSDMLLVTKEDGLAIQEKYSKSLFELSEEAKKLPPEDCRSVVYAISDLRARIKNRVNRVVGKKVTGSFSSPGKTEVDVLWEKSRGIKPVLVRGGTSVLLLYNDALGRVENRVYLNDSGEWLREVLTEDVDVDGAALVKFKNLGSFESGMAIIFGARRRE